jgi:hydroxymethylglutaryl-CoA lyase
MTQKGKRIYIQEVATRDGFQNESRFVATDDKVALVDALSECGFAKIEVTSFTSPRAIPALRDAEEVMHRIRRRGDVIYTGLVPNVRGAQRAMASAVDEINLVMSVSETHNCVNLRMSREASFRQLREVIAEVKGEDVALNVSLSTAFGCPMEGDIATEAVLSWMDRFAELGVSGFSLCDTTGMAFPDQVGELSALALARYAAHEITIHLHNTRGMALANALAAIGAGVDRFDASLGGIGGCPYAPGATGNVCTEDLVHMLNLQGYDTGMALPPLMAAAGRLAGLIGHDVPSQLLKAGERLKHHAVPEGALELVRQ